MMSAPQSLTVYVLKSSKDDKYYIGSTRRPLMERIGEHAAGQGSAWTNRHPMDTCLEYKLDASPLDKIPSPRNTCVSTGLRMCAEARMWRSCSRRRPYGCCSKKWPMPTEHASGVYRRAIMLQHVQIPQHRLHQQCRRFALHLRHRRSFLYSRCSH